MEPTTTEEYYDIATTAEMLQLGVSTLHNYRTYRNGGPVATRRGRRVYYSRTAILAYAKSRGIEIVEATTSP